MEANKILGADVLDIIFEGKNKEYGAYQLRKSYKKTLTKALIITGSALLLIVIGTVLASVIEDSNKKTFDTLETQLAEIKAEEPPPPLPAGSILHKAEQKSKLVLFPSSHSSVNCVCKTPSPQ